MQVTIDREELVALVQELVRIDSVNPYLDADGPGEKEIAEFLKARLEASGLEVHFVPINETAVNVIGILRGSGGGRSLLLNGHLSTEEPIFATLEAACRNRLGRSVHKSGFSGWTDAALIQGAGIPTVLFGPTGAGLHGAVEYVETDSLVDMAYILAETICEFCG